MSIQSISFRSFVHILFKQGDTKNNIKCIYIGKRGDMMSGMVVILLFIIFIAWLAIDLGVGKKVFSQAENTFPKRRASLFLFADGNILYKDLFHEMENASSFIHLSFYIVQNDEISQDFLDLLVQKAQQNIEVRLLVDRVGSYKIKKNKIAFLKKQGVHFAYSRTLRWPYLFYTLNARNHRKIAVIDGKVGYIGGFNIGREYLGLDAKLGVWKDYHLRMEGEGIQDLQMQLLSDWYAATGLDLRKVERYFPPTSEGDYVIQLQSTEGFSLEESFLSIINQANRELYIGTPYFIPSEPLMNALLQARARGVQVHILIPMRADQPLVHHAAFAYLPTLLQAGCMIYQYYYGFYHAKVLIADNVICDVGTANFDKRSLFLNAEINCLIYDATYIEEVKNSFKACMGECPILSLEDVKNRKWSEKLKQGFATFISPLL